MVNRTQKIINKYSPKAQPQPRTPIAQEFFLPDHSGIKNYIDKRKILNYDKTVSVLIDEVTVSNTTDETILWTGSMGENSVKSGTVLKVNADGVVSNNGPSSSDQVTIRVKVGGQEVLSLTPITKTLTDIDWHIDANATQRTLGTTGQRAFHFHLYIGSDDEVYLNGVGNIDTTASMDIEITAQWASADTNNTISIYQGFLELKG